jgi:hypothetical protein
VLLVVDSQLNAKLADLEMGGGDDEEGSEFLGTDDILVNWVAPEVNEAMIVIMYRTITTAAALYMEGISIFHA